jgi:vancomycin permeability regulator SanA
MRGISVRETAQKAAVQWIAVFLAAFMLVALAVFIISGAIADSTSERVYGSADNIDETQSFDCVLVLGAGLKADGTPSHMLEDRIKVGADVFGKVNAGCILMSGDRSGDHYDEPAAMRKYAEELGIDPSLIIVDNEGYSTYESIMRAKEIYGFDKIIVVTQEYHLYRALYIADKSGIDAVGIGADLRPYRGQTVRDVREILARAKDFFLCK